MRQYLTYLFLFMMLLLSSCSADMREKLQVVPYAIGPSNQLAIITDDELWESPTGDTLNYFYTSAFLILPQPEPIFDVLQFSMADMQSGVTRRELRSYLIVADLADKESPTTQLVLQDLGEETLLKAKEDPNYITKIGRDKWASGQLLIYVFGVGKEALEENIKKTFPAIKRKFNEHDESQIDAKTYLGGENVKLNKKVNKEFGINLKVPYDYVVAISDDNSLWLRRETADASSNILIHKLKYSSEEQLSKEGMKALQLDLGQKYITTSVPGAYMSINDVDLPMIVESENKNGIYSMKAYGIWEMTEDFMGGPFHSYIFKSENSDELIYINTFVHAPGVKKRKYMQYLDHVISSFSFAELK